MFSVKYIRRVFNKTQICHFVRTYKAASMCESKNLRNLPSSQSKVLNDGNTIPLVGLGCWKMHGETAKDAVVAALRCGYRLVDTAYLQGNEVHVGFGLKESGLKREEYFVSTKLEPYKHGYVASKNAMLGKNGTLDRLGLDYVDLFLINDPSPGKILETWRAFVEMKAEGYVKSIGVSCFGTHHLDAIKASGMEMPAVNQIEFHPFLQQADLIPYCEANDISIMGWSPLARGEIFKNKSKDVIDNLCTRYGKSRAQITLRWALQRNIVVIPKSSNPARVKENFDVFDFELTEREIAYISGMNISEPIEEEVYGMQYAPFVD